MTHSFYSELYRDDGSDENARHRVLSSIDKHLSTDNRGICEGPLTLEKCTETLKHLKINKSPGMDELPTEFYRHFLVGYGTDLWRWLQLFMNRTSCPYHSERVSFACCTRKGSIPI